MASIHEHRRRKMVIASSSSFLLLLLVVGMVAVSMNQAEEKPTSNTGTIRSSTKSVQAICASTDYKQTCEKSLIKLAHNTTSDPKEILKAAVVAVIDEISTSFSHSTLFKSNDSRVQDAIDDCWEMYQDSKEDLVKTLNKIIDTGLEHLPSQTLSLKSWLSAALFYQQTCVDGFPEGEHKNEMRRAMKTAKELTSNALVLVGQVSEFVSMLGIQSFSRRLLSVEDQPVDVKRGYPSWVSDGDRRLLKEHLKIKLKPNVTVAQDGSGDFRTINEAIRRMPHKYHGRYVIYVKEGIYKEAVNLTSKYDNITMYGDGPKKSIVTGNKNFKDGTKTSHTATFVASGEGFMAIDMGFHNTAGPEKEQAVALRVQSDRSIFLNCRMEGYQDTLYAQSHLQFYRGCIITGTIDFVFGDASAVFQNCLFLLRRPLPKQRNIVTAHGRSYSHENTGFVIQHSKIKADESLHEAEYEVENYLARPWKEYSRTVFMENQISSFIHPAGYMPWDGDFALKTLYYAEYNNKGEGSNVTDRVKWPGFHVINRTTAEKFTVANFIEGERWIPSRGASAHMDLYYRQKESEAVCRQAKSLRDGDKVRC